MTMRSYWVWEQWKRLPPFTWLGKLDWEYTEIEDAGQSDNGSGDADRITPDAAGDAVTADEATARPVDTLRVAWNAAHIMARLRGYQSDAYRRMAGVFDNLFAYSKLAPSGA